MPWPLLLAVLPAMVLLFEVTLIPASAHQLLEFVSLNLSSVIPSALNLIALLLLPASTTGLPLPVSKPLKISCLYTSTFS